MLLSRTRASIGRRAVRDRACHSARTTLRRRRFSIARAAGSDGQPRRRGASARHRRRRVRVGHRVPSRPRAEMDPRARRDTGSRDARGRGTPTADAPLATPTPSSRTVFFHASPPDERPSDARASDHVTRASPRGSARSRRSKYRASRCVARRLRTGASGCAPRYPPTLAFHVGG